jgi:hypothetical protein
VGKVKRLDASPFDSVSPSRAIPSLVEFLIKWRSQWPPKTKNHQSHQSIEVSMPYTAKQHALFQAAAHNKGIAKAHGMSQADAKRMAGEGVKKKKVPWHAVLKQIR